MSNAKNNFWKLALGFAVIVPTLALGTVLLLKPNANSTASDKVFEGPQLKSNDKVEEVLSKKKLVKDVAVDFDRTVYLDGEVHGYSMNKAIKELKAIDDTTGPIFVLINSPGGSVFDGERFISAIESASNPVYTVCTNLCASMGAIIHQYGTKRFAYDRSVLMFHDASGGLRGPVKNMKSMLSFIERKIQKVNAYIAKKSGMSYESFMKLHAHDLWIDAEDAKDLKLVDDIIIVKDDANRAASAGVEEKKSKEPTKVPYAPKTNDPFPRFPIPLIELEN